MAAQADAAKRGKTSTHAHKTQAEPPPPLRFPNSPDGATPQAEGSCYSGTPRARLLSAALQGDKRGL
jgi:hypothetical protein